MSSDQRIPSSRKASVSDKILITQNISANVSPSIVRVILYVKNMAKLADFYQRHFGFRPLPSKSDDWLELVSADGGCAIALHQASTAQKRGAAMKLVFGIADVRSFIKTSAKAGLKFGPLHAAEGFEFSNAKDPAGNSIQISSRGFK
jgi:catechol 2,3-dioxygenase-like lactoylglutathione lyase family enzyme